MIGVVSIVTDRFRCCSGGLSCRTEAGSGNVGLVGSSARRCDLSTTSVYAAGVFVSGFEDGAACGGLDEITR